MGRRRKGRELNGILLLDKPLGISSNDALQRAKRIFGAAKAGHTGALDPLATGMLPICFGEATKFSQFLLDTHKTYEVTAKLGVRTTTSDADGEVVQRQPVNVTEEQLTAALDNFRGDIKQVPSMFSALKHQGKPLYHYARQGIEVPREARDITIYHLHLERFVSDEVDLTVHCSKGTYIRSLVDDLGQLLGCGAYVSRLHRIQVGDYPRSQMVTFGFLDNLVEKARADGVESQRVLDPLLLPMDSAVEPLTAITLDEVSTRYFQNGNPVQSSQSLSLGSEEHVRVYDPEQRFLGVAQIDDDGRVAPRRLVVWPSEQNE